MSIDLIRFEMSSPEDTSALLDALVKADARNASRIAIVAKTEGPATVNDFGRSLALNAIHAALHKAGSHCPTHIILSMGSEGLISPGGYLIVEDKKAEGGIAGLALGMARSAPLAPSDLVNGRHIEIARDTALKAIADAGIGVADVAIVLAKSPLLTHAMSAGLSDEQLAKVNVSSASRAAASLGIGAALGEVPAAQAVSAAIGTRHELCARRAMVFSGTESEAMEIIVLGNRKGGPVAVRSGLAKDLIDIDGMAAVIAGGGQDAVAKARSLAASGAVAGVFLKAGVAPDGLIRGHRTTVFSSDLDPDKHMRAAASGVLGALLGDTRFFISGGAEHQAPPGGCILAAVLREPQSRG